MSDDPFRDAPPPPPSAVPPVPPQAQPGQMPAPGSMPPPDSGAPPPPGGIPSFAAGGAPPPGYVGFGTPTAAQLQRTAGLRTATIMLFWVVVALDAVTTFAIVRRRSVVEDFFAGTASFSDVDAADDFVAIPALISLIVVIALGIVLSIWSLRVVRNFLAVGGSNAKPGWACGGWYIPIGNLWVPWGNLRRGQRSIGGNTTWLSWWQALWIIGTVIGINVRSSLDTSTTTTASALTEQLDEQVTFAIPQTIVLAIAAFVAMRATREAESSVAARVASSA